MQKKTNRVIFSLILITFSFCGSVSAQIVDRIVAIVNDDIVTWVDLNKESRPYLKKIESLGYSGEQKKTAVKDVYEKILDGLIDRSLTRQEANRYGINVTDSDVDRVINSKKESGGVSQDELVSVLKSEGLTLEEYRENLKMQIVQTKIINHAVKSKVIITEAEINDYYEANKEKYSGKKKYHLRNILMGSEDDIEKVKNKLDKKASFASLAKTYSSAANAVEGGDLGVFDIDNFPDVMKESIATLEKGGHTDVISTANGFQIFYLQDIVLEGHKTYEQAHDEIRNELYGKSVQKRFKTWLESLKEKAHIKKML